VIGPRPDLTALRARPHADVLIIGGGINGLGILRDLALQGVDVALVERGDYCSGASAASSHMIHGGLRYLENGEFRLVREALRERNDLLRTAPHFVAPQRTTVPLMSTFSGLFPAIRRMLTHRPSRSQRGALLVKAGLTIYDAFARRTTTMPGHRIRRRGDGDGRFAPAVRYLASYYDAVVREPERLAIDLLLDATSNARARAANYVAVVGARDGAVELRNTVTGEQFEFGTRVVINVTGPWADVTNGVLGLETRFLGGTRGSHIVLDHPELLAATTGDEIFFEHADGRIVLILPLGDRVLVGTSDLWHDIREPAVCTPDEIAYFLELVEYVFPAIRIDHGQIVHTFSGVRPLPRADVARPGFVSRDYRVEQSSFGSDGGRLLTVVGGKWTTFRALAERVSDQALDELGRTRAVSTLGLPIGGGAGYPITGAERERWLHDRARSPGRARAAVLLDRYGTRADDLIEWLGGAPETFLDEVPGFSREEVAWLVERESVVHLSDVLERRTGLGFTGRAGPTATTELAAVVGDVLGWSAAEREAEIARASARYSAAIPA
jgi:glycerol-3-phosphate dehydrogenase